MAPTLYTPFGGDFTYLNSDGVVHAAHSGIAVKLSPCQMDIIGDGENAFVSRYSHISVLAENEQRIQQGDVFGIIQTSTVMLHALASALDNRGCFMAHWQAASPGQESIPRPP